MPGRQKPPDTLKRAKARAGKLGVAGRSGMSKKELARAVARKQ